MTRNQFDQKCDVAIDIGSAKMTADIELTYWKDKQEFSVRQYDGQYWQTIAVDHNPSNLYYLFDRKPMNFSSLDECL